MNAMQHSDHRGMTPASPLFASSWMALFLLLRHEFGTRLSTLDAAGIGPDGDAELGKDQRLN